MGDRLLVIIDVQQGFVNEWTRHIPDLVAKLQHRFEPVFVTRFENPEGSPFRAFKALERFAPESPETALAFHAKTGTRHIVKCGYSAATPEVLAAVRGVGGAAYLCGIATDNCVLATALDLFAAGLRPVVLADVCASHGGPQYHEAGLLLLRRLIGEGQVATARDIVGE